MPKRCALGCSNYKSYHQFPHPVRNPDRFKAWVHIAGGKLDSPADYELYRKKVICDIHFADRDRNRNNRLNFLAVPSLHLPESTSFDESPSDENSIAEVTISTTSDATKTDPESEKNTLSNLADYWKSATAEVQEGDQPGSNLPALSDAADDAGSSEDDDIQEPPLPPQLNLHTAQMCRVCLALDVKMFDLTDSELKTMFQFTTGITFEENKDSKLGNLICWECAARLQAATTFISKALFSDSLLQGLIKKGEQIPKQYFETVKDEADSLIPPKTLTVTEIVHIVEIEDQHNMNQLVQSGDDDEPSLSENDETEEIIMYEIKDQIIDENSKMEVEGDKDITEGQNRTKILKEYPLDSASSIDETINAGYSRPLLDIGHTSLRSDSTSPRENCDNQISKTFIKTHKFEKNA